LKTLLLAAMLTTTTQPSDPSCLTRAEVTDVVLLAPLPPDNLGGLFTMLARLGLKGESKNSKSPNIHETPR
jgi:hypothetical protein